MHILLFIVLSIPTWGAFLGGCLFVLLLFVLMPGLFAGWLKDQQRLINEENSFLDMIPATEDEWWSNPGNHRYDMYFILGQSGSGKDTQVKKVIKHLESQGTRYIYVSIGDCVRGLIEDLGEENFFAESMKRINDQGKLQPPVLPIHFFLSRFIPEYTGNEVVIVNGSPRSDKELKLWAMLIQVGYLPNATIVHLDVTDEECRNRLLNRPGRPDTVDPQALETKLSWYKPIRKWLTEKLPTGVRVVTINGMGTEDDIAEQMYGFFAKEEVLL